MQATSKPMREITERLIECGEFEITTFGDKVILDEPVEKWPLCDVLLSWHSDGFPLRKAQAYVALRRPFLVNDVRGRRRCEGAVSA
jgi:inositol hexakisphosphate/diphosphoinositol-pentakisphosphate kinase